MSISKLSSKIRLSSIAAFTILVLFILVVMLPKWLSFRALQENARSARSHDAARDTHARSAFQHRSPADDTTVEAYAQLELPERRNLPPPAYDAVRVPAYTPKVDEVLDPNAGLSVRPRHDFTTSTSSTQRDVIVTTPGSGVEDDRAVPRLEAARHVNPILEEEDITSASHASRV